MKYLATFIIAFVSINASGQTAFTQQSNQFCAQRAGTMTDGTLGTRFTCSVIPTATGYQALYADLNNNGTFVGQFTTENHVVHEFAGSWVGTGTTFQIPVPIYAMPSALSGAWDTGSVTSMFSTHKIGCGRNCTRTVPYLQAGSGVE